MDPEYIKNMPITPHDQTSNQHFVDVQLCHPSNKDLLPDVAREVKVQGWIAIYTRAVSQFIQPPYPAKGRPDREP